MEVDTGTLGAFRCKQIRVFRPGIHIVRVRLLPGVWLLLEICKIILRLQVKVY